MKTTIYILETIFSFITDMILGLYDLIIKPKGCAASFGKQSSISSRFNKGFVIFKGGRRLTRKASFTNVQISGPTGAGKTVKIIIKNLYELKNCSILLTDPSKEIFNACSGYLTTFFNIICINPTDSLVSAGFNFLDQIKKQSDINKLVHVLVSATLEKGSSGDPFWSLSVKSLLSVLVRLVMHQPKEYRNMANVLHILNELAASPRKVDEKIVKTKDADLLNSYKAIIATPEKTLQNVIASARAALGPWEDPEIAKTTSQSTIDLDTIRQKPTIIFLHSGIADQKYVSTLTGLFFEQVFAHFLEKIPGKDELDVFVILEEASSIYIPLLPLGLANLRKHRVGTMVCLQQGNTQLKKLYGPDDADNISSNCLTKIFLPGITEMHTLQMIETLGGKTTDKKTGRISSLISSEAARVLPDNKVLVLHSNKPIILGRVSPFYKSFRYRSYSKIPPVELRGMLPDGPPSLMQ